MAGTAVHLHEPVIRPRQLASVAQFNCQALFRRRAFHEPNLMQMSLNKELS